ncbi:MAG TPA: DUF4386 domain-containing protein [Anaerolineales bacterium]|nr:DUF4386 domain-containing protein [Anaerolineales bacterium]
MTTYTPETSRLITARVAGFVFLVYIAAGITSMNLADQSPTGDVLSLLMSFSALVLGVTLYVLTRDQGPALAMMALVCRILEAVPVGEPAIFFAVGSTIFSWLLLRGRMIPVFLAWLGVIASALLVVILPLQIAGLFGGSMSWSASLTWLIWLPMLLFEVVLALWFLVKGIAISKQDIALLRADSVHHGNEAA